MTLIERCEKLGDIQSKEKKGIQQEIQLAVLRPASPSTYTTQPKAVLLGMSHD
jgi:hypothetical protein